MEERSDDLFLEGCKIGKRARGGKYLPEKMMTQHKVKNQAGAERRGSHRCFHWHGLQWVLFCLCPSMPRSEPNRRDLREAYIPVGLVRLLKISQGK